MRRVTARHKWTFVLRPAPDSAAPLTHRRVEVLAAALCDFSPARGETGASEDRSLARSTAPGASVVAGPRVVRLWEASTDEEP